jgi:hypothetical protein
LALREKFPPNHHFLVGNKSANTCRAVPIRFLLQHRQQRTQCLDSAEGTADDRSSDSINAMKAFQRAKHLPLILAS